MRDIKKVITAIKAEVPTILVDAHKNLDKILKDCDYCAPEAIIKMWYVLNDFLNTAKEFNPPVLNWQLKIVEIYADRIKV